VRDLDKAKSFYGGLFDWKIASGENKDFAYWQINTGEKPEGGLWRMPKEKPCCVLVYIMVDNINETLEKVIKHGGKVVIPKSKENGNAMATFEDPDGNRFGLYEYARK
jgi:predicted enzyme related to lactoylglutathione lyase